MRKLVRILAAVLALACIVSLLLPVSAANSGKKLIALTFDDGPGKDTPRLLDALRSRGVRCTFFIVGSYAERYPQTIRQCYEDGHQIANHSYSHPAFTGLSDGQIRYQLDATANALNKAIGADNTYMCRPPYGDYNDRVLKTINAPCFYWSDDSGDWRTTNTDTVYNNVISGAGDGDILLLHDSHSWSVDAAIRVVDTLLKRGFEFVTLSELYRRRGETLQNGKIYRWLRDTGVCLPEIAAPVISVEDTELGALVSLTSTDGLTIRYTTDGSVPNAESPVYSSPFYIRQPETVRAVCGYDMNGSRSKIAAQTIKVNAFAVPQIDIAPDGTVTMTAEPGVSIHYTTDGSAPTMESPVYSMPFYAQKGSDIQAFAFTAGLGKCASDTLLLRYTERGNVFADLKPGKWFYDDADYVASCGLMRGTGNFRFSPYSTLTRAMLVTTLYRLNGGTQSAAAPFADVAAGKWYSDAIAWAAQNGIVNGFSSTRFGPDIAVTREQAAAILYRYSEFCGYQSDAAGSLATFTDAAKVSAYARTAMQWAVGNGLINGIENSRIDPKGKADRAQIAAILHRYLLDVQKWERATLSDEALRVLGDNVLEKLKSQAYSALREDVHPEKGITFTPYLTVNQTDITVFQDDFETFSINSDVKSWGKWDGSGEPISMTFSDYRNRFIWDADYTNADHVSLNQSYRQGLIYDNLTECYPSAVYIDYDMDSTDGANPLDWRTLRLVFERLGARWYLVAIVHNEWTA